MSVRRLNPPARPATVRRIPLRFDDVLRVVDDVIRMAMDWNQRQRQRRHLAAMDDRMLKDIGVSAADAAREVGKPFWRP